MKQSRFIEQIMVVGDGEKMPAALVQPNWEFIESWSIKKGKNISADMKIASKDDVLIERIMQEVNTYNEKFGKWEKIKLHIGGMARLILAWLSRAAKH